MIRRFLFVILLVCFASVTSADIVMKVPSVATCDEQQSEEGASSSPAAVARAADNKYRASRFQYTGPNSEGVCQVNAFIHFTGSSSHEYKIAIFADDGGSPAKPTGAALGTSDAVECNGIGGSEVETAFTFSTPSSGLTLNNYYHVSLYSDTTDGSNYVTWHDANGTVEVQSYSSDGSSWDNEGTSKTYKYVLFTKSP